MNRRHWPVAAGILAATGLVTVAGLTLMLATLLRVVIDVLEIVSLPHG